MHTPTSPKGMGRIRTVHGLDPEGEPTAADVEEVISKINEDEINVLFIEEYTQASSVDVIVDATGVEVMYLYTMESLHQTQTMTICLC